MSTNTSRFALVKPDPSENYDVAVWNANSDKIAAQLGYKPVTLSTFPTSPVSGETVMATDDGYSLWVSNGSLPASGSWKYVSGGLHGIVEASVATNGTTTSTSYTATLTSSTVCGVAFIAPPSGKVMVHWQAGMAILVGASNSAWCSWEIRAGNVVGSGTPFLAADNTRALRTKTVVIEQDQQFGSSKLVTGLTPRVAYNIQLMQKLETASSGTVLFGNRSVTVDPKN